MLYDLEYLVDESGRRVAAFGERAGFVGAALGLLALAGQRSGRDPVLGALEPWADATALVREVSAALAAIPSQGSGSSPDRPRALVIGALGRSGRGAVAMCEACGVDITAWDIDETAAGGPFDAVLEHELLISCVFVDAPTPPFTTREELVGPTRLLRVVVDVGCDPFGSYNPLPLYGAPTTLDEPVKRLLPGTSDAPPLDLVAIDHLPSLLPVESSEEFSALLLPHLLALERPEEGVWERAARVYEARLRKALEGAGGELVDD